MRGDSFVGDNEWKCLELMCVDPCLCEDPYDKNTYLFSNSCNISEIYNAFQDRFEYLHNKYITIVMQIVVGISP
jgi:DNA polymerase sigma